MTSKPDDHETWHVRNGVLYHNDEEYALQLWDGNSKLRDLAAMLNMERQTIEKYEAADHNQAQLVERLRASLEALDQVLEERIKDDRWHPQYILGMAYAAERIGFVLAELREGGNP